MRNETSYAYFLEKVVAGPEWIPLKTVNYGPTSFWAAFFIPIFTGAPARFPTVALFGLLCLHLSTTSHALTQFESQSEARLRTTGEASLNSVPRSLQAVLTSSHINNMCLRVTDACKLPRCLQKKYVSYWKQYLSHKKLKYRQQKVLEVLLRAAEIISLNAILNYLEDN